MKLNFGFTVIARCLVVNKSNESKEGKEDIELNFDIETASKFLFRFYGNSMLLDGYKLLFSTSNKTSQPIGVTLFKDEYMYCVLNYNQIINDVIKGYNHLVTLDKVADIMEFDFNAAIDDKDIEEEF